MIANLSLEAWRTLFIGIETMIFLSGSIIFTLIKTGNPNYSHEFIEYVQTQTGGNLATIVNFDIRNKGWGIGKIKESGFVLIILHNGESVTPQSPYLMGGLDGQRIFPGVKKGFNLAFSGRIQPEDIYEIQLTLVDEKSGEHFMKIRPNELAEEAGS